MLLLLYYPASYLVLIGDVALGTDEDPRNTCVPVTSARVQRSVAILRQEQHLSGNRDDCRVQLLTTMLVIIIIQLKFISGIRAVSVKCTHKLVGKLE